MPNDFWRKNEYMLPRSHEESQGRHLFVFFGPNYFVQLTRVLVLE